MKQSLITILVGTIMTIACSEQPTEGSFAFDHNFLQRHDSSLVELKAGKASILVSPKYQGKVFTSSANGEEGRSFGWINYKAFTAPEDPHMNAYGGENRLWLGPEGGKFSVFFRPGDAMIFNNWKTPAAIDTEIWELAAKGDRSVTLKKQMQVTNYTGSKLDLQINRTVTILSKTEIENDLELQLGDSLSFVGYSTSNQLTNTGGTGWTEQTGMPCIWILDMFNPSPATTVVIPYKPAADTVKVATTGYFGEIPADRIKLAGNKLFFKADGKSRGKLGILPLYVLPKAGSYDATNHVLTITIFDIDNTARYLNQEWNTERAVFSGDAMNAYNDGPLANGGQLGPFYEIESVSPAAELKPGASIVHDHNVYHFQGAPGQLNIIAQKILGVSLDDIQKVF